MESVSGASRVVITGTGFAPEERRQLQQWVLKLGARYSPDLVHSSTSPHCHTTHLVCKSMVDAWGSPKYTR